MTDGPYSRVYWTVMSDEKFDGVREDVRLFGAWALLLVVADMAWPAPAFVPPTVAKALVDRLATVELIDRLPGSRFRVHGLDAERAKRSDSARNAAALRWHKPGNAEPMLGKAEAKAEPRQSTARDGLPNLVTAVSTIWETATGRSVIASGAKVAEYLDDACRRHPPSEVGAAIIRARKGFDHIPDGMQLVSGMRPILDPFVDGKAATKADHDREERAASRRRVEATIRNAHGFGAHDATRDPRCPLCLEATA